MPPLKRKLILYRCRICLSAHVNSPHHETTCTCSLANLGVLRLLENIQIKAHMRLGLSFSALLMKQIFRDHDCDRIHGHDRDRDRNRVTVTVTVTVTVPLAFNLWTFRVTRVACTPAHPRLRCVPNPLHAPETIFSLKVFACSIRVHKGSDGVRGMMFLSPIVMAPKSSASITPIVFITAEHAAFKRVFLDKQCSRVSMVQH
jgi:hypothetical protein